MAYRYGIDNPAPPQQGGDWWSQNAPPQQGGSAPPQGITQNPGETPQQTLARYQADYHSDDRDSVLRDITAWAQGGGGGGTGPQGGAPQGGGGGDASSYYNKTDPASISAYVKAKLAGTGREGDQAMWERYITSKGGGGNAYWDNLISKNQGGDAGGGGGGGGGGPAPGMSGFTGAPGWGTGTTAPNPYAPPTFKAPDPYTAPNFKAPAPFTAPTGLTEANDPGFQARLKMGTDALQNSAAARGSVLSGGTLKALDRYSQDYASNEFGNVYNRALTGYNVNAANDWRQQENQAQYGLAGYNTNAANNMWAQNQNAQYGMAGYDLNARTQRNAQQDYWNRLYQLYQGGLTSSGSTYNSPPGAQ